MTTTTKTNREKAAAAIKVVIEGIDAARWAIEAEVEDLEARTEVLLAAWEASRTESNPDGDDDIYGKATDLDDEAVKLDDALYYLGSAETEVGRIDDLTA